LTKVSQIDKKDGIVLIIEELKNNTSKIDVMAKFGKIWQVPKDTFNKWWKIANDDYSKTQQGINSKANDVMVDKVIDAQKVALERKIKRLEILNNKFEEIAKMHPQKLKYRDAKGEEREVNITKGDYLKGIEVMARLDERISKAEGTDAPSKVANTDAAGKDVDLSKFSTNELATFSLLNKKLID
jgi:hypothetical protein